MCAALGCGGKQDDPAEGSDDPEPIIYECSADESLDLYDRRIAPLMQDDRPSSCNQCHLSEVDLSVFVQATPCETMACMVDQGLVDLDEPSNSVVLSWIDRATPSGGITAETIAAEHDAVMQWIDMSSQCGEEVCEPVENPCGNPLEEGQCDLPQSTADPRPLDDPGDCSDKTLELVWRTKVYAWRGRCFPCHFDTHADDFEEAPAWVTTGSCNPASLTTLRTAEREGYLNADDPLKSPLITKPLEESLGGVEHGGGAKIHDETEASYVDIVYFLDRWAECNATSD